MLPSCDSFSFTACFCCNAFDQAHNSRRTREQSNARRARLPEGRGVGALRRYPASFDCKIMGKFWAMTIANAVGFGVVFGIVLFFVLQRMGLIDKFLQRLER